MTGVNNQVHATDHAMVDVLPRDITTLPHVLGSDLIGYLTSASAEGPGRPGVWDAFIEAAQVVDPCLWYRTSFDATPERSVTRWLPPDGSGVGGGCRLFTRDRDGRTDQVRVPGAIEPQSVTPALREAGPRDCAPP